MDLRSTLLLAALYVIPTYLGIREAAAGITPPRRNPTRIWHGSVVIDVQPQLTANHVVVTGVCHAYGVAADAVCRATCRGRGD